VIAGLATVGVALVVTRSSSGADPSTAGPPTNALVGIDPTSGKVQQSIPIEVQPVRILNRQVTHVGVAAEGGVWLARDTVVLHVDPEHDEVREPPVHHDTWLSGIPISVVDGSGDLWASSGDVARIDGATDETESYVTLDPESYGTDMAFGGGMIWITDSTGALWRVNPEDPARVRRDDLRSGDAFAVAADGSSVWVADTFAGSITPIDPETMRQGDPVGFSTEITLLTVYDGEPWVLSAPSATVATVGSTNVARVGPSATSLAAGLGSLWVGDENGEVYRVDPDTFESTVIYRGGGRITTIVPDEERNVVWVDVGQPAD
jgi:streptogramin lyase